MSSAAATACTCTPRCQLNRTAASLNSALYSWTFFGPARGTDTSRLLGGSVYKSEGGTAASFKRLLGCALQGLGRTKDNIGGRRVTMRTGTIRHVGSRHRGRSREFGFVRSFADE